MFPVNSNRKLTIAFTIPRNASSVSDSIPVSLLFPPISTSEIECAGDRSRKEFEGSLVVLSRHGLFLASYIWAVDAARLGGLEDLDKDDAGKDVNLANSHVCPSSFRAFFFLSRTQYFPFRHPDRSLTATYVLCIRNCAVCDKFKTHSRRQSEKWPHGILKSLS